MIKENFHEAKQVFQNFLSELGLSSDLLWVFGEDVVSLENRFLIKVPLRAGNESFAEACYNIGFERGLGLCLHAFCLLDGRPCCYVQLPEDDLNAQYSLMGNLSLKCCVRSELINAEPIDSFLVWQTYRLGEKFSDPRFSQLDKLPFRKAQIQAA
jgi:hypothetical protein